MKKLFCSTVAVIALQLVSINPLQAEAVTDWHTFRNTATTLSGQGTSNPIMGTTATASSTGFLVGYLNSPVSLVNVGDKISFTYDIMFNDAVGMTAASADNFRFGLFDLNGEAQVTDENTGTAGTTDTDNLRGYWFGVKSTVGGAQGSIRKRTGTTSDLNIFANASADLLGTAGGTHITYSGAVNGVGGALYSGSMTLELTASGLDISGFFSGNGATNLFSVSDNSAPFASNIGAVAFLNGGGLSADQLIFQNVDVTFTPVPEPSVIFLTSAGLAGLFFLRGIRQRGIKS